MSTGCMYMPHPAHTLKGRAQGLFRRLSYDLWKRELKRFGLSRKTSSKYTIVDVGCGPGFLLACLEGWFPGVHLIGVDANDQLLQAAQARCRSAKLLNGDACRIPIEDQSADVVFALHVTEHLPAPSEFFDQARRVLRPGGLLVIATPNADGLGARIMKGNWQGFSDPTHIALHAPPFWRGLVKGSGFSISREGTTGLTGIPWLNKMPLGLVHWVPTFFFGFYPWERGEAYICVAVKQER